MRLFTTLLLAILPYSSLKAEFIGAESFSYPDESIGNLSGGTGWDFEFGNHRIVNGALVTDSGGVSREYNGTDEGAGTINDINVEKAVYYRVEVTTGNTIPTFFGISAFNFDEEEAFIGKPFGELKFGVDSLPLTTAGTASLSPQPNSTYTLVAKNLLSRR